MEPEIRSSLQRLLEAVTRADGPTIARETVRLDDLAAQGRGALHPQLVHFLERRSYAKALMFLDGDADIPAGICGGGRRGGS
jgi:hypothetical protein